MMQDLLNHFRYKNVLYQFLLDGNDVIGQAHTGTGKTAAFALLMIQLVVKNQGIQGIIMAPTRELALQITSEIKRFAKNTGIVTATILWWTRYGNTT